VSPRDAVIDLDRLPPEPAVPPRPPVSRRHVLTTAVLAVALLMPAGAAAPTRPVPGLVRTVWIPPESSYEPVGDRLYVTEGREPQPRLAAYPLSGGPARWSTSLPLTAGNVFVVEVGRVAVVTLGIENSGPNSTVGVDRSTGKVLWQNPLPLAALDPARNQVLLGQLQPTVDVGSAPPGAVVAVAVDTGRQVWAYHREHGCVGDPLWPPTGPHGGLVVLCADGVLRLVDLGSGEIRRTVTRPGMATVADTGWGLRLAGAGDVVVVMYAAQGRIVVNGLDRADLAEKWTTTVPLASYQVSYCGQLVCLFSPDAVVALDPDKGQIRWRLQPGGDTFPFGDRYLVAQPVAEHPTLIDSATGRTVLSLSGWLTAYSYEEVDPVFFRPDPARNRMWLAVADPDRRALRVLGWVPQTEGLTMGCAAATGYVVCRTVKDAVQVWRTSG
jgi:outer membrane protein assembly factor BamB